VEGYDSATYGDRWAAVYDRWVAERFSSEGDVDFLAELARGGRALELGIGTGRVAIPLAERGIEVVGIDASERMLELLRGKTDRITAIAGDMGEVAAPGEFDLVYVVFNTFFGLLTQDDQARCFARVAGRLKPDGAFVIQAFVPDLTRFDAGHRLQTRLVEMDSVEVAASSHDAVGQTITTQILTISEGGIRMLPVRLRYAWPSELDLMARLAGLRLRERYESFERHPFTAASVTHVSVYSRGE
jgi:SAM-dependent methyltransferase